MNIYREDVVLSVLENNRFLGKSLLKFGMTRGLADYFGHVDFDLKIESMLESTTIEDVIMKILTFNYPTYIAVINRFQCYANARRSTTDIWRIYRYYKGEIDIFSIMRALYKLVYDKELGSYRCPTVRKRVFCLYNDYSFIDWYVPAELKVPIKFWKDIGENSAWTGV